MGKKIFFFVIFAILFGMTSFPQNISIQGGGTGNTTANALVSNLVGQGVTFQNAHYTVGTSGHSTGLSTGTGAMNNGYFTTGTSAVGISSGIILSTGNIFSAPGPNDSINTTISWGGDGDANIQNITTPNGNADACGLEFDFVPQSDIISFRYIFASEEYPEWVGYPYNDIFAFFISGPGITGSQNIALIPGTSTPVTINNVNSSLNSTYYVDNTGGTLLEYDGRTTVLTAQSTVIPCQIYHMKLIVADVGDTYFDSSVLLESGSFTSPSMSGINVAYSQPAAGGDSTAVEGCSNAIITLNMSGTSLQSRKVPFYLTGTASFGSDYTTNPDIDTTFNTTFTGQYYVTIPAGSTSTNLQIIPVNDTLTESPENVHVSIQVNLCSDTSYMDGDIYILDNSTQMSIATSPDTSICYGSNTNISCNVNAGQLPLTYSWDPVGNNANTINVAPTNNQIYHVTVTDACGLAKSDSLNVVVYPLPTATLTGSDTICPNTTDSVPVTLTLTGTPPWTVLISDGTNSILFDSLLTSSFTFNVLNTATTTYTIMSISDIHCTGTILGSPVTIEVTPIQSATMSGPSSLCNTGSQHDSIAFSFTGVAPWTIYYSIDSLLFDTISGITTSSAYLSVTPTQTNTYYLEAMNDAHCVGTVSGTPLILQLIDLPQVNLGSDTLSCSGNYIIDAGNQGTDYLWNTAAITNSIIADTTGTYSVTVTNSFGCESIDTIQLTIGLKPDVNIGADTTICTGTNITLHAGLFPNVTYSWSPSGNTDSLIVTQTGTYAVTVINTLGCSGIDSIHILIDTIFVVNLGNDTTLCSGASITLHAGSGSTYIWNNSTTNESLTATQTGSFSVTVTNANNCSASDTVIIAISTLQQGQINGDDIVCEGYSTTYQVPQFPNHTYSWTVTGGSATSLDTNPISIIWNTTGVGTLTMTETETLTNCSITTNTFTVSIIPKPAPSISGNQSVCAGTTENYLTTSQNGYLYSWNITGGIITTSTDSSQVSIIWGNGTINPGILSLSVDILNTSGCLVSAQAYDVSINTQTPVLQTTDPDAVCFPATVDLTSPAITLGSTGVNGLSYWIDYLRTTELTIPNSVETTGTYYILASNACGESINPIQVIINNTLPLLVIHNPAPVCFPLGVDITDNNITSGSQQTLTYLYWANASATTPLIHPDSVTVQGTYYIAGYNACGSSIDSVFVIIHPTLPGLIISNPDSTCTPFKVNITDSLITAGSTNVYMLTYWEDSIATHIISFPEDISITGIYYILAQNACGSVIKPVAVFINPHEINVHFSIIDASCSDGVDGSVKTAITGGHEPYKYKWNTSPYITAPMINSIASGTYILTVTDTNGCTISDTAYVNEINTECLVIPSAFTPNNDDNNDKWEFKNIALYPNTKVEIYSRWGTLVFKSEDYQQSSWDGKFNGNDVPAGSYIYIVRQDNGYAPIQGTLTIIR